MVALIELSKTAGINSGMMNKNVRTVFLLNKAVALAAVKPFDNSIRHGNFLLS
jgi:hypothetical protein